MFDNLVFIFFILQSIVFFLGIGLVFFLIQIECKYCNKTQQLVIDKNYRDYKYNSFFRRTYTCDICDNRINNITNHTEDAFKNKYFYTPFCISCYRETLRYNYISLFLSNNKKLRICNPCRPYFNNFIQKQNDNKEILKILSLKLPKDIIIHHILKGKLYEINDRVPPFKTYYDIKSF